MLIVWLEGPSKVQNNKIGCENCKKHEGADTDPKYCVPGPRYAPHSVEKVPDHEPRADGLYDCARPLCFKNVLVDYEAG